MNFLRQVTDTIISAAFTAGREKAYAVINGLRVKTRKNFRITAALDAAMIAFLLTLYFLRVPSPYSIIGIVLVNLVIIGRRCVRVFHFMHDVYRPYSDLIYRALPAVWRGIIKQRSIGAAAGNGIRAVFRFYFEKKMPDFVKNGIIPAAETSGILKPLDSIEDDAVREFNPIILGYVREAFVFNFLLLTLCYGAVIFIIRHFAAGMLISIP